ncbi:MAG: threonine--tRNA ligase [Candidatus Sumerlaeia bacterium]|nr:threonine--tRNA ligase [Candidatus Sumerlaeia bacterium]
MSAVSSPVVVTLPDGSKREYPGPVTPAEVAASIGAGLAKAALAATVNGKPADLQVPIDASADLSIITTKSKEALELIRHSTAHLMAQAIKRLHPEAMLEDGPATEDGFFYDIWTEKPIAIEEFPAIEAEMGKLAKESLPITRRVLTRAEAIALFTARKEKYKIEIIARLPEDATITIYEQGDFLDLCRGPHVPHTGWLKAFKLMTVSGAYWKGDATLDQLTRVRGTAFATKEELDAHLTLLEEAKKRDHRRVGREMGLFMHHEWAPGETFWLPKGRKLYRVLGNMMSNLWEDEGYQEVFTPMLFKSDLFKTSGHWDHYQDNMFIIRQNEGGDNPVEYSLKPMNCPSHMLIFRSERRSYRELPMRIADQGVLHRNEASGTLSGLTRVRQFCQDDAHIFLTPEQIEPEITALISLVRRVYKPFGLEFAKVFLSTRPENYLGRKEQWDAAEDGLRRALENNKMEYQVNEGDGAFYGPKIDFIVSDALKREWQTATIQLDYQLPQRFELSYVDADGSEKTPVVVHRAIFGSLERFLGVLIEHYAGWLPVWLAPEQVRVLTISERSEPYAREVFEMLSRARVRVAADLSAEKIGSKIRGARIERVPYMVVIGEKEAAERMVAIRARGEDAGTMTLEAFLQRIEAEKATEF